MTRVGVTYSKLICLPRFSSTSFRMPSTYSSLVRILAVMMGSRMVSMLVGSGQREGLRSEIDLPAALLFHQLQDAVHVFLVGQNLGGDDGLSDGFDVGGFGPARRIAI